MRVSFISDLHLDGDTPQRNAAFAEFLETEAPLADAIYILGDLTEAWIGDDDDTPFARWLVQTLARAGSQCQLLLMHGNRDFLLRSRFAASAQLTLISDPHVFAHHGSNWLLTHGDAYCTEDHDYLELRTVLRSEAWQTEMLSKSLPERRAMAASLRAESRAANKSESITDVTPEAAWEAARSAGATHIVHGHTHRPAIHEEPAGTRIVLGEWDRCGWVLRLINSSWRLQCFPLGRCET